MGFGTKQQNNLADAFSLVVGQVIKDNRGLMQILILGVREICSFSYIADSLFFQDELLEVPQVYYKIQDISH